MNQSVTNFYAQKFFKENADGFSRKTVVKKRNFSNRRNFENISPLSDAQKGAYIYGIVYGGAGELPSDDEFISTWKKFCVSKDPIVLKYCKKAEASPDKSPKALYALGAAFTAGASQIDGDRWAKIQDKFKEVLANSKTVASAKEQHFSRYTRRYARNFAKLTEEEKSKNQIAAVKSVCGSADALHMARAQGAAVAFESSSDEDMSSLASKFNKGMQLTDKEAKKLLGKVFKNFSRRNGGQSGKANFGLMSTIGSRINSVGQIERDYLKRYADRGYRWEKAWADYLKKFPDSQFWSEATAGVMFKQFLENIKDSLGTTWDVAKTAIVG